MNVLGVKLLCEILLGWLIVEKLKEFGLLRWNSGLIWFKVFDGIRCLIFYCEELLVGVSCKVNSESILFWWG